MATAGRDFFISYTGVNRAWAEWIAVQLEATGYSTVLQAFDFRPGSDFVHQMHEATSTADRTVAVLSPAYFASAFSEAEWRAAFAKDPSGEQGLLVPVRVQECRPPGLLATRVYVDLVNDDEPTCRRLLLDAVSRDRMRPTMASFPGSAKKSASHSSARFPGAAPEVSNLPPRNRNFSGRSHLLEQIHADLQAGSAAAVVPTEAVHGLGGIGKTELAMEFAYRFGSDYDIAWWIPAEEPTAAAAALAGLARKLGIPDAADRSEMVDALFDDLRSRVRWLLVYDNAERPDQLTGLLPRSGGGHVLVTSRWQAWGRHATPLRLGVLSRPESVAFLEQRIAGDSAGLDAVAELLGDLPLALEEAAAYLEDTQDSVHHYLQLMRDRSRELLALTGHDAVEHDDHGRVGTVWSLSLDRVRHEEPAAEALLNLCAFLAPEVPRDLPTEAPEVLPADLGATVSDRLSYNRILTVIGRYSLATVTPNTVGEHRLVQSVIRARLDQTGERAWAEAAVNLVRARFPIYSHETTTWAERERLLPQVLAVIGHAERLGVAGEAAGMLRAALGSVLQDLGDRDGARVELERALQISLGPDHPDMAIWRSYLGRNQMGDWLVVPGARNPPLIPVDPPDTMGGFRFARTSDGAELDGTPTISAERGRVDVGPDRERLLGYLTSGALVAETDSRSADRFEPYRQHAVPARLRTDGIWIWPEASEYYLRWHGVAPEPDFRRHIVVNNFTCSPVPDDVVQAARAAAYNRSVVLAERIEAWKAARVPVDEASAARFSAAITRTLRGLGWWPGRDVATAVETFLIQQAPALAQLSARRRGFVPVEPVPAAMRVLREFGGLISVAYGSGKTSAQVPFRIFPTGRSDDELVTFADNVRMLTTRIGARAFQIGIIDRGMGGLVVDDTGRVFAVGPSPLYLGATFDEALVRMLEGIRAEELYEIGL